MLRLTVVLAAATMIAVPSLAQSPPLASTSYDTTLGALRALAPDTGAIATVTGLTLRRDEGTLVLDDGQLTLLTPVEGRTVAALYLGRGRFRLRPPLLVERQHLERLYEVDSIGREFETLLILFADSTESELRRHLAFAPGTVRPGAERAIEEAVKFLTRDEDDFVEAAVLTPLLNGHTSDLFYAHFYTKRGDPTFFVVDPTAEEEVSVRRKARRGRATEVITQFDRAADLVTREDTAVVESRDVARTDGYRIESRIANNLDFTARATFDVMINQAPLRWLPLRLFWDLEVDSVLDGSGSRLPFHRPEERSDLWVDLQRLHAPGDTISLTVAYHGDLLEWRDVLDVVTPMGFRGNPGSRLVALRSTTNWWPGMGGRRTATFDLTFHTPDRYKFVSVGDQAVSSVDGEVLTTRWVARNIRNVGFNLGRFDEHPIVDPRIPPVTLQIDEQMHRGLGVQGPRGQEVFRPMRQDDMAEQVSTDVVNSMSFFQDFFGPSPTRQFVATEIPGYHGEAFPGLVHFSWLTYQWTRDDGSDEIFRAHEVAHQWWGIAVDFATYRDQWLSEGFSTFAGIWYLQQIMGNNEEYFETLKEWREDLQRRRDKRGPIWLGYRVQDHDHPGDYSLVVYRKGAWVLHMLRNLMVDFRTMNEEPFQMLMRDFYSRFVGRRASTADFQAVVSEHIATDMGWFFDQWVYGRHIPTYKVARNIVEQPEGEFTLSLRIGQENVPDDFKMIVPVRLDFGDAGSAWVRILVDGPLTEVDIPGLPARPRDVVFNDLESVLAEVDWERW